MLLLKLKRIYKAGDIACSVYRGDIFLSIIN